MMELTDRHFRFLMRSISSRCLLYTEMLTAKAVLHGDSDRLLGYNSEEHPVALQLGGSEPGELAEAAEKGIEFGYDEINLNVGCPSDRVKSGRFGACLMAEPDLVGQCVRAMADRVSVPVTVKCRIGIDRNETPESLNDFVSRVASHGCTRFIVHARKAWLDGLSPKENRTIPPLRYDMVYALKAKYPELSIVINGGIDSWSEISDHLAKTDGVMIGREAYYHPAFMLNADNLYGENTEKPPLHDIARRYGRYMQAQMKNGVNASLMIRHLIALYQQVPGARAWRRHLSENARDALDPLSLIEDGLKILDWHASRIDAAFANENKPVAPHPVDSTL